MDKSIFFLPYTFKSKDRQRLWAIGLGAGVGLAGFGYLGDLVGDNRGSFTYVIIVVFSIVGHFLGQYTGAALYDLTTRNQAGLPPRIIHGLTPFEWVFVGLGLSAFTIGAWSVVSFYYYHRILDLLSATLSFRYRPAHLRHGHAPGGWQGSTCCSSL